MVGDSSVPLMTKVGYEGNDGISSVPVNYQNLALRGTVENPPCPATTKVGYEGNGGKPTVPVDYHNQP